MKKMSFARRNAFLPRSFSPLAAGAVGVVLLFVVLRVFLPDALASILKPVSHISNLAATAASDATSSFSDPVALQRELDDARINNDILIEQNAALIAKAEDLERLLGDRVDPAPGIVASVVSRPPMSPYDTLLLDQGADAGVEVGATVSGPGGTPIGSIVSVSKASSRALLYSAAGFSSVAWVGEERLAITLTGAGGGAFDAVAPKEAVIAEGDPIYMSNDGMVRVGTVLRIDSDAATPSVVLRVQPSVNLFSLTWVTVAPGAL